MNAYRLGETLFVRTIEELAPAEVAAWDRLVRSKLDLQRAFLSRAYIAAVAPPRVRIVVAPIESTNRGR